MACLSFGCCYGKPLREASPRLARLFGRYHAVFHGETKKAAYASGLAEEPLIPVQAITSVVLALAGLVGLALFLAGSMANSRHRADGGDLGLASAVRGRCARIIAAIRAFRPTR